MRYYTILIMSTLLMSINIIAQAQNTINIGICKDANSSEFKEFAKHLKTEISNLNSAKYSIEFTELNSNMDTLVSRKNIQELMTNPKVNYVIALGYISSKQISELKTYSKPVIAATILDRELQNLPLKPDDITGLNNFTYIESVINLKNNLEAFSKIFETKDIAVIIPKIFKDNFPQIDKFFNQNKADYNISVITADASSQSIIKELPKNTEAAIVLPLFGFQKEEIKTLFDSLNTKHIPSLAVSGVNYLNMGATVTMTPEFTFQQLARQLALRIMKINEGTNPSQIKVSIDEQDVSIINMESIRACNKFPKWNILNESILINVSHFSTGKDLNLRMTIAEALENNLQGKMAAKDVEIADKDVRIAKANILPQLSVGGSTVWLSENLVEASMGQRGAFTLTGSASIKQVIFSESVFANIAIQKLMAENKKFYNEQAILDVVSNTSMTYISLLFAKSNLLIQNENVNTTMKNLQMAKVKEEAGQTNVSDVNRWVSELNINKMKFNDAYTTYRSNMYQINKQLNIDINGTINITDSNSIDKEIFENKEIFQNIFKTPVLTERYASFIIEEMKKNSPELHQLESMAQIIERKSKLYKHQWFTPELVAFGGADQAFIREGTIMPPNMPVPTPPDDMTFNAGLSLKIPIFQGGKANAEAKKSLIELDKITYQKEELLNTLEVGIRSSVQKLRTSYLELELSENAANAAEENFKMVQDAYFQGAADLIKLIDAQNVMIRTKHMANISYYQYVLDNLIVQRYQGHFTFLDNKEDRDDYILRLKQYLLTE